MLLGAVIFVVSLFYLVGAPRNSELADKDEHHEKEGFY